MTRRIGIAKHKNVFESNSYLAPIKEGARLQKKTIDRANSIQRAIQHESKENGKPFVATAKWIVNHFAWANKDNIRTPCRYLITKGRMAVNINTVPITFTVNTLNEPRRCKGTTKENLPCSWMIAPHLQYDYCKWHKHQDPSHYTNNRHDIEPFVIDTTIPKMNIKTIHIPSNVDEVLFRIEREPVDNIHAELILQFLEGEATLDDLRESVRHIQEELKG